VIRVENKTAVVLISKGPLRVFGYPFGFVVVLRFGIDENKPADDKYFCRPIVATIVPVFAPRSPPCKTSVYYYYAPPVVPLPRE